MRILVTLVMMAGAAVGAKAQEAAPVVLEGAAVRVELGIAPDGAPHIASVRWNSAETPLLFDDQGALTLGEWLPGTLIEGAALKQTPQWRRRSDRRYDAAEADVYFDNGLRVTWLARVFRGTDVIELGVRYNNTRNVEREVPRVPAWLGRWSIEAPRDLRAWEALSYAPIDAAPAPEAHVLSSRLHSSDRTIDTGHVPFWRVRTQTDTLYFGLAWSGGWRADILLDEDRLELDAALPQEESQLVLGQGGFVEGPVLVITPVRSVDESEARSQWMGQRAAIARTLYNTRPVFPFVYNSWYAARFAVDETFLDAQIAAMPTFGFDAFVVDAGWYQHAGNWRPHATRFPGSALADLLAKARNHGAIPGLWTSPQFLPPATGGAPPKGADTPGLYEDFIDAHLRELSDSAFTQTLTEHVTDLRARYGIGWWKYDQAFFAPETRAGVLRNVAAFQDALEAVRLAHPDLMIENCQSGGRMINEFTLRIAQAQWLRDGGATGLDHARANLSVALNALDLIPPAQAARWTNNIQQLAEESPSLVRYYARSAMAGVWGVSADLPAIATAHVDVLAQEAKNYRRLTLFKEGARYAITPPETGAPYVGITFSRPRGEGAAMLYFRWDDEGSFDIPLDTALIEGRGQYLAEDVDTGVRVRFRPGEIARDGLLVHFDNDRQSALVFISPYRPQ